MKKGYKFKGAGHDCPFCDTVARSPQGLSGHVQLRHPEVFQDWREGILPAATQEAAEPGALASSSTPAMVSAGPDSSVKALKQDVEKLELLAKRRRLEAEFPEKPQQDLMSQAGLGTLTGEALQLAQRRALGLAEQKPTQSLIEKLLTPPVVSALLDRLLNNGNGSLSWLRDLGIDIGELLRKSQSPAAPPGFTIGGVSLAGVPLTEGVASQLIAYEMAKEARTADMARTDAMIAGLGELVKAISSSPENFGKVKDAALAPIRGKISAQGEAEPTELVLKCPECNFENIISADIPVGTTIKCGGENCERSWTAQDSDEEFRKSRRNPKPLRQPVRIIPPTPDTMRCSSCGQLIDITGRALLESVRCPACEASLKITDPEQALIGLDVEDE